jgi:xanthine dehydrogenase YagR molybdenum-binding subunit
MMDALAAAIGMDPVELRLKNIPDFSQARPENPPYTTTGFKQCLQEGAAKFGWQQLYKKYALNKQQGDWLRGVGVAGASWIIGNGFGPATIIIKLFADGSVNLNMGASDIGTGTKTVMAMVVSEELGIKPESIQIEHADTGTTQFASVSGGSKTVPTEAPAVRDAAIVVKRELLQMAAEDLKTKPADLALKDGKVYSKNEPANEIPITDISRLKQRHVIIGVGNRGPRPTDKAVVPFGAQFCEVAVNAKTGELKVLRFLGAHDSGRVMNRLTYDNQVFGGITMGIGLATTEKRYLDHNQTGKMVNRSWYEYKLPTSLDVPVDMQSLPIEIPDDAANTTGAKGLGEPVTIPTAAAVANAIYNATGIRITDTPVNPVQLSQLLANNPKEG